MSVLNLQQLVVVLIGQMFCCQGSSDGLYIDGIKAYYFGLQSVSFDADIRQYEGSDYRPPRMPVRHTLVSVIGNSRNWKEVHTIVPVSGLGGTREGLNKSEIVYKDGVVIVPVLSKKGRTVSQVVAKLIDPESMRSELRNTDYCGYPFTGLMPLGIDILSDSFLHESQTSMVVEGNQLVIKSVANSTVSSLSVHSREYFPIEFNSTRRYPVQAANFDNPLQFASVKVNTLRTAKIGKHTIPTVFCISQESRQLSTVQVLTTLVSLSSVKIQNFEDSIFASSVEIPNGTKVSVEHAPQIRHEWLDGRIVNSIDKSTVQSPDSAKFVQTGSWRLVAIVAMPLMLLLVLIGWRYRSRRRANT